jgi:hypothetical protein
VLPARRRAEHTFEGELDMKLCMIAAAIVAAALTVQPALAQSPKPADKGAQAQPTTPSPAEFDKQLAQMREHMQQMQTQMSKIQQTQDPQERQRLLQEHWTSMQAAMGTMHGMWGPAGGGCCAGGAGMGPGMMMGGPMMGWGHMRGYYSGLTPEQIRQRQYMMDQYMPMQQMMMDHMMWHQRWMTQPPAPATK